MSTKKRKSDDDLSDDNSDSEVPLKKRKPKVHDSEGVTICEISKNRKVAVRMWKGKLMVDIREFYVKKDGKQAPGTKGISLTVEQWSVLRDHIKEIDKAIARSS